MLFLGEGFDREMGERLGGLLVVAMMGIGFLEYGWKIFVHMILGFLEV